MQEKSEEAYKETVGETGVTCLGRADGVCQVFCVSFKKKIYGEGNLPLCIVSNFIRLLH